jgi:signal transduction histidine kinase
VKIRNRITLWITGAGLLAALLFSVIISYELIEQPFEMLDRELDSQAYTMLAGLSHQDGELVSQLNPTMLGALGRLYWFKLFNQDQKLIYASDMTTFVDLPVEEGKNEHYTVNTVVPREVTSLEQEENDEVTFRVHVASIPFGKSMYLVQIARPMDKLQEEIIDLVISIVVGLAFFAIALLLLGYLVAGKVIQPIAEINTLAREISDKTLDKRIPLGENQDEIYVLSSPLNQMFDRLQFSFKRQKEFIANASHEFKTPIAMQ